MDKYTVDLDKVLNDFEYSELTEQYSGSGSGATYRPVGPKHSINNVFHSLNEYLNTEIPAHNNNNNNNSSQSLISDSELEELEQLEQELEHGSKSLHAELEQLQTRNKTIASAQQNITKIENLPKTFTHPPVNIKTKTAETLETIEYQPKTELLETTATHQEDVSKIKTVDCCDQQITKTVDCQIGETVDCPQNQNETIDCSEEKTTKTDENQPKTQATVETIDCRQSEANVCAPQIAKTVDEKIECRQNETIESHSKTVACEELETNANHQPIVKTVEYQPETIDCQPANTVAYQDIEPIVKTIAHQENETKSAETGEYQPETIENNSKTVDYQQFEQLTETNENPRILVETIACQQNIIKTIENPSETNDVNETIESQQVKEITEHQETNTCETITDSGVVPETVESAVEETVECDNNRIIAECDKQENVVDIVNSVGEEKNEEFGEQRRGSIRPNSLELNDETPAPPIDLIGAPGSTPYNNTWSALGPADVSDSASSPASPSSSSGSRDTSLEADTPTPPSIGSGANVQQPVSSLGLTAPFWTPDADTPSCLHCAVRFTLVRRRHHCRACGLVLCARCCSLRAHLVYLGAEARVCSKCFPLLQGQQNTDNAQPSLGSLPRPGNPMEYCSTVSPLLQAAVSREPPSVMVPQSVLKRQGSAKSRGGKSVTFMDGVRPGSELAEDPGNGNRVPNVPPWPIDSGTGSYLPSDTALLPPRATKQGPELVFTEQPNNLDLVQELKEKIVSFAINRNFLVHCKIVNLECCMNTWAWCFTSEGLMCVGQDEIVILLELENEETTLPRDILLHFQHVYNEASRGHSLPELGLSLHPNSSFLGSPRHAGLLYIRPTFQCLQKLVLPTQQPYLVGLLVHRWETPWAKMFPLRLVLRLGAHYRYYPAPLLSTRGRDSVYVEIGHTIINLLADFRNYSYTLPTVRGLMIHMETGMTTVLMPRNRYEQVARALANSSEHIVALGAAFSRQADAHLVCLQDTQRRDAYSTHAINIHNKPRKITGASFIVLNGALKASSGLMAKSSIVEDGVMVQLQSAEMAKLRASLLAMKDHRVQCGPSNSTPADTVAFLWTADDTDFNQGVTSPIDGITLQGVPSVRVHNGRDHLAPSSRRCIRWTEVFLLQNSEDDVSRISECISRAAATALGKYLDLLASSGQTRLGIRATLNLDNVSYLAGGNNSKLPPLYMNSLDSELVPVLHRLSQDLPQNHTLILELIFHILYT